MIVRGESLCSMDITNQSSMFRIVMIGDSSVGKTSIVNRLVNNEFNRSESPTNGASFLMYSLNAPTQTELQIWDTAGQERFKSLGPIYYRNSSAAVIVFDSTNDLSFKSVPGWIDTFVDTVGTDPLIFICANKVDILNEKSAVDNAKTWAAEKGYRFAATSALTGEGIKDLFQRIAEELIQNEPSKGVAEHSEHIEMAKKSGCC